MFGHVIYADVQVVILFIHCIWQLDAQKFIGVMGSMSWVCSKFYLHCMAVEPSVESIDTGNGSL